MMAAAVAAAAAEGAEAVIHCGDIIGGNTLRASLKLGSPASRTIPMSSCTITARMQP